MKNVQEFLKLSNEIFDLSVGSIIRDKIMAEEKREQSEKKNADFDRVTM